MQEDLAHARLCAQLKEAEQYRRNRMLLEVGKAQRYAERARRRAERAAAKARLAVERLA